MKEIAETRVLVPYMFALQGGVSKVLSEGLPKLNQQPDLIVEYAELCCNQEDMDQMERCGVPVIREAGITGSGILSYNKGLRRKFDLIFEIPRLTRVLLRLRRLICEYDVVYIHGYRELLLVNIALRLALRQEKPKIIWHCHGVGNERPPLLLVKMANDCCHIIAISQDAARRLNEIGVNPSLVSVIYNALSEGPKDSKAVPDSSSLPVKATDHFVVILPASSIRMVKGLSIAVQALKELPSQIHLWITGDTSDPIGRNYVRELDGLINEMGVVDRVHFIGRRNDIYLIMREADLVLVPSLCREGFGLVAAEAMLLEKPVIVSNRGALPEVLGSTDCGWIFDPDVAGDLQRCILEIMLNPTQVKDKVRNGKMRAEELFAYKRWVSEVASVLIQTARLPRHV